MIKLTAQLEDENGNWTEREIIFNVSHIFSIMPSKKTKSIPIIGLEDNVQTLTEVWMSDGAHFWVKETMGEIWAFMHGDIK